MSLGSEKKHIGIIVTENKIVNLRITFKLMLVVNESHFDFVVDRSTHKMMKITLIALTLVAAAYASDASPAGPSYPVAYGG